MMETNGGDQEKKLAAASREVNGETINTTSALTWTDLTTQRTQTEACLVGSSATGSHHQQIEGNSNLGAAAPQEANWAENNDKQEESPRELEGVPTSAEEQVLKDSEGQQENASLPSNDQRDSLAQLISSTIGDIMLDTEIAATNS